jgi:hypothetical protein
MLGEDHSSMCGSKSFFTMSCNVCGRRMRVPIHLLGGMVRCQHCSATSGTSIATSSPGGSGRRFESGDLRHSDVGHSS